MKKNYMKPAMTVVPLHHRMKLLNNSGNFTSMRSNLSDDDAIEYGGKSYQDAR